MELPLNDKAWQEMEIAVTGYDRATVYVPGQPPEFAQQRTDNDGVLLWDVFCTVHDGRRPTNFKVRLASAAEPGIDGIHRIRFGGLRASTYPDGSRNIVTFTADTFALGEAPSVRAERQAPAGAGEKKAA
ncbi:MAG: hypothetical protein AAGA65_30715 [Actinomycetota bacterium]